MRFLDCFCDPFLFFHANQNFCYDSFVWFIEKFTSSNYNEDRLRQTLENEYFFLSIPFRNWKKPIKIHTLHTAEFKPLRLLVAVQLSTYVGT